MSENKNKQEASTIFREKSVKRMSSPEDLNHYIKSTTPALWVVLLAIIILLVGTIVWAAVGTIDAGNDSGCIVRSGRYSCYVNEVTNSKIDRTSREVPYIKINNIKSSKPDVENGPLLADDASDYLFHLSDIEEKEWYYIIEGTIEGLEDGLYMGFLVTEEVSPLSFVFN